MLHGNYLHVNSMGWLDCFAQKEESGAGFAALLSRYVVVGDAWFVALLFWSCWSAIGNWS
jgi:hypothetical protein